MPQPLLSLIIPTRERAQTLAYTLATALDQQSRDYEVVVSDNHSSDGTRPVVEGLADARVVYVNTGQRLSMCDNYEFALSKAQGRYILIIGDDDAVIPNRLDDLLARLRATDRPVPFSWPLHVYDWPVDGQPAQATYLAGDQPERETDLKATARRVMTLGGWRYGDLPSPYHAAIPTAILDALRARTGRVFHSTQPDVFTGMAIPAFADRAINLGRTVTMNGRSPKSNGRDFLRNSSGENLDTFIREYGGYQFHSSLFRGVSAKANMIPDALLVAKDMFPDLYGDVEFDYTAMWAYICRLRFASYRQVLANGNAIRQVHGLKLARLARMAAMHEAAGIRRTILNRLKAPREFRHGAPDNIHDFVRVLAGQAAEPSHQD